MAKNKNKNQNANTEENTVDELFPSVIAGENLEEDITLIASEKYHGYDFNGKEIKVIEGEEFTVSNAKAVRLIEDFPELFTVKE